MIGNSHTQGNDLHKMLGQILEDGSGKKVEMVAHFVGFLSGAEHMPQVRELLRDESFDIHIYQAQEISSSHKYTYSTEAAEKLLKQANERGIKAFFFAEWPQKGVDESKYIEDIYQGIAKKGEAEVLPNGQVWDELLKIDPKMELWSPDGNHSSKLGAFVAATNMAYWINGGKLEEWTVPAGVSLSEDLKSTVIKAIESVYERNHPQEYLDDRRKVLESH